MRKKKAKPMGRTPMRVTKKIEKMLGKKSDPVIATLLGVSTATVLRWRKQRGIASVAMTPDKIEYLDGPSKRIYVGYNALRFLYHKQKKRGFGRACDTLGISYSAGTRWSKDIGLGWLRGRPPQKKNDLRRRMIIFLLRDHTLADVGMAFNLSPQRVQQIRDAR